MLVNSFDTKYSLTAKKYESLDSTFYKTVSANKKFSRIFTSVIEDKSLKSLSDVTLRSVISERRVTSDSDFKDLSSITDVKILENFLCELRILLNELSSFSYFAAVFEYFVSIF